VNGIQLHNISKKFGSQLIFSDIGLEIKHGTHTAITGYNGSGKSTLLQIIAGFISPTTGTVNFQVSGIQLKQEDIYLNISYAAPYLDLMEDLTFRETVAFYSRFKQLDPTIEENDVADIAMLTQAVNKPVRYFSSGMKQRLKLTLALVSRVPFILLDEPVSNLDKPGVKWYHDLVSRFSEGKTLVISSNESEDEINFCKQVLRISEFKNN
jgi:ABC-type multidrug transport system ATPase subunit